MQPSIPQILQQVKSNKKYKSLVDEIVLNEIKKYLKKNPNEQLNNFMIKEIRKNLHKLYSSYQTSKKSKREKYLNELKQAPNNICIINKILSTNISTKERLQDYQELYYQIFSITGKPKTIIDLACGLNPFSFSYMKLKSINYYAYDIDESDINFLNEFFKIKPAIKGNAQILDINNESSVNRLPNSDIIFIFKLIDLIDIDNHKPSEQLINLLIKKTKFIVASFAIKTLSKRTMNFPKRKWFEIMLNRLGIKFKILKKTNEIYYILHK